MLDRQALSRGLAATEADVALESGGELAHRWLVPGSDHEATLMVEPVVDAVRIAKTGHLVDVVDRDLLWRVAGVIMRREVAEQACTRDFSNAHELIEVVVSLGYVWEMRSNSS